MRTPTNNQYVRRATGLTARSSHLLGAFMLACLLPCAVSAYTIIMRGGRRINAPDNFIITQTTLTYAVAPGLNVTLPLAQIDITATERANNELPGSLLRRVGAQQAQAAAPAREPARTLTNRELEPVRNARLASERAYESRRKALGLPAPSSAQRSAAEEAQALRRIARRYEMETAQAESYWRGRAAALRVEAVALAAEIKYINARLDVAFICFPNAFPAGPSVVIPFYAPRLPARVVPPGNFGINATDARTQLGGTIAIGGGIAHGQLSLAQQSTSSTFQRRVIGSPGTFAAPVAVFATSFNYAAADESALRVRLVELEAARAGLDARQQQLEDEARRAGALPGWLRP